ncbi:MAG: hypothetical protein ACJAWW_002848, partial [Sulfurimonas sp.]
MKKTITISFLIISIFTFIFYYSMQASKHTVIQNVANKTLNSIKVANDSILDTYKLVAQKSFHDLMKSDETLKILKEFKHSEKEDKKNILRGELYRLLYKEYDFMKTFNIRQFHFHTYDGKSLLRFHLPYENGDSLMNTRTSIRLANTELKNVVGFEGGRIFPAYRYVFPIIDKGEHLGSVEFSIAFEAIEERLQQILPFYAHEIIMNKAVSYDKVFKGHIDFFIPSRFSNDYYIENTFISEVTRKIKEDELVTKLTVLAKASDNFSKKLHKKQSFAVPIVDNNKGYVVTFLNLKDIDHKDVGYIVSYANLPDIIVIERRYLIFTVVVLLGAILLFMLATTLIIQMQKAKSESLKFQKFINVQNSIIILTDGRKFKFANKSFFDFFDYEDIKDFTTHHHCICELFIKKDGFFSLANFKHGEESWITSILTLSKRQRIVTMRSKTSELHAF